MRSQSPPAPSRVPAPTRRELVLVAIILIAGVALRLLAFSRSAVEHFDEGVYASNIYFGPPDYAYPQQRFFAPPLLPALIEAGMITGLPPNVAALLPGLLAGCATILALWWFGRSWFGVEVGLSAAALIALSDFHAIYSATALTDVLLGLWLVLALDAVARSLLNSDVRWAIAGGLFTGLAWWTKYNGWLPLAIEAAALPLLWLMIRLPSKHFVNWLLCLALTAIVALLSWAPYQYSLQSQGGYAPIAANHARYFVGFSGWLDATARQISSQFAIEALPSWLAVMAALALPAFLRKENIENRVWRGGICIAVGFVAVSWSSAVVAGIGAVVGIARFFLSRHAEATNHCWRQWMIGLAVLIVWWSGLLVAVPCYAPYPRLALPLLLASSLGLGLNTAEGVESSTIWSGGWFSTRYSRFFGVAMLTALFAVPAIFFPHEHHLRLSRDRRGLIHIAQQIRDATSQQKVRVFYVFGEPAMLFQLRARGEELVAPVQDIPTQSASMNGKPVATMLIVGPHAHTDPRFKEQWSTVEQRWQLLQTFDYKPSAVVWLDLHDPRRSADGPVDHSIRLYQLRD